METGQFTISDSRWATFSTDSAFIMPDGVTGNVCIVFCENGASVHVEELYKPGDVVPARTPLLINGNAGTYTYYTTESDAEPPANNSLRANYADDFVPVPITDVDTGYYIAYALAFVDGTVKFRRIAEDKNNPDYYISAPAGKAYLLLINNNNVNKQVTPAIKMLLNFEKVFAGMKSYSDRKKWFHKLKWLLGRIKSCKCGNVRHIGKVGEGNEESVFVEQLRAIFR